MLAKGTGWHVHDVVCHAGPKDRPFEETHATIAIALVVQGTFQYRTALGSALMTPGSIMLGNYGACFECGHEHTVGDRCVSFHYQPAFWEELVAAVPGARRATFRTTRLVPAQSLVPLALNIRMAAHLGSGALEVAAIDVAGSVLGVDSELSTPPRAVSAREERRVAEAIRIINGSVADVESDPLTLAALSNAVGMSTFHFLRTFRELVGSTPHQYVIRQRMHRAAEQLLTSSDGVSDIAFGAGFGDLSTFNRHFKRLFGVTPRQYRAGWHARRRGGL